MTDPSDLRELLLRSRRMSSTTAVSTAANDAIWSFGEIKVDQALRAIVTTNGSKSVPITAMEFKLLRIFTSRAGLLRRCFFSNPVISAMPRMGRFFAIQNIATNWSARSPMRSKAILRRAAAVKR